MNLKREMGLKKERDSGIEVMRILAALCVIGVHALSHGHFMASAKAVGGMVHTEALLIYFSVRVAVNAFVIISGYFMVTGAFDLQKAFKRAGSVYTRLMFYSLAITAVFLLLGSDFWLVDGKILPPKRALLLAFFPLSSQALYFLTDYLLLCLLAPFANLAVQKLTKRQYLLLLVVLTLWMSVWLTLAQVWPFSIVFDDFGYGVLYGGKNVFHFIYIYLLGGYVRLHVKKRRRPNPVYLLLAAATVFGNYLLHVYLPAKTHYANISGHYANPLIVAEAVLLLLFFKDLHFKSRAVNRLASTTLGVYAIQEFRYMKTYLWKIVDYRELVGDSPVRNLLVFVGGVIAIYLALSAIDLLREGLFRGAGFLFGKLFAKKKIPPPGEKNQETP
ncbi:MAG: acyltransferase [Clostridia bacterium]|nr:acyltransferase [Clostridia bacterium]